MGLWHSQRFAVRLISLGCQWATLPLEDAAAGVLKGFMTHIKKPALCGLIYLISVTTSV